MSPEALTDYLHQHIPLVAALNARVLSFDGQRMEMRAPLAPNVNHRGTAFGGSLTTLGIVCGWALVNQALHAEGIEAHVMVHHIECDFREPVTTDFIAVAILPATVWPRFLATLRKHRRARIDIDTVIATVQGQSLVKHHSSFAAITEST